MTDTPGPEPTVPEPAGPEPEPEQRLPVPRPPVEPAPVERFTSAPSTRTFELTPERSAQVVRQSSNARWVGFLAVVVVILFVAIYWFYELGTPLGRDRAATGRRAVGPAGHGRRARLQHLPGQLRALPRRRRAGWDRTDPQQPGEAVRST